VEEDWVGGWSGVVLRIEVDGRGGNGVRFYSLRDDEYVTRWEETLDFTEMMGTASEFRLEGDQVRSFSRAIILSDVRGYASDSLAFRTYRKPCKPSKSSSSPILDSCTFNRDPPTDPPILLPAPLPSLP
jgi:hypothetical protein